MEVKTFLAFSCTHCPCQDDSAIDFLLTNISRRKSDIIIHLGDGHEANSASRWPNEYDWPLSEEFESHNKLLKRIRKASINSRRIFLPGNHEDNLQAINRIDPKLRNLCNYFDHEDELDYWELPAEYVYCRRRGAWRLGQVTFAHGYEYNQSADEFQSILLGVPYGLYVGGHTHKPVEVMQATRTKSVPLPYWYANAGCLRTLKPEWMHRRRTHQWGHAIVVGEIGLVKSPRMSRSWSAETIIHRMYDDD